MLALPCFSFFFGVKKWPSKWVDQRQLFISSPVAEIENDLDLPEVSWE